MFRKRSLSCFLVFLIMLGGSVIADAQTPTQENVDAAKLAADLAAQLAKEADEKLKKAKAEADLAALNDAQAKATAAAALQAKEATDKFNKAKSEMELSDLAETQRRAREKEERTAASETAAIAAKSIEDQRAALPKSNVTVLEGKTEVSGGELSESRILGQRSIARIASEIARVAKSASAEKLILVDATVAPMMWQHVALSNQLTRLNAEYMRILGTGVGPQLVGLEVITAYVASAAGLMSLFRTDTKIETKAMTVSETALVADLVNALRSNDIAAYYPPLALPDPSLMKGDKGIYKLILDAMTNREKAETLIANKHAKSDALKALNVQAGKLVDQLYTSDEKGQSLLVNVIKAEWINTQRVNPKTMSLAVKVEFAAGSSRTQRNLFIFTGSRLSYSAGVGVSYFLMSGAGDIIASRTLFDHSGFVDVKDLDAEALLTNIPDSLASK